MQEFLELLCSATRTPTGVLDYLYRNPTLPMVAGSLGVAYQAFKTQRHLVRSKHAIDFEAAYHSSEMQEAVDAVRTLLNDKTSDELAELASLAHRGDPAIAHLRNVLNSWERVAIAIQAQVYDEAILYRAYATLLIGIWIKARPFIRAEQKRNQRIFCNLDWLATRWWIQRAEADGHLIDKKLRAALSEVDELIKKTTNTPTLRK